LLSIGLVFLGGAAMTQQRLQMGLLAAWAKVSSPPIAVDAVLHNPFPVALPPGWSLYDVGVNVGWLRGVCVYLALGYMTFFYRWKVDDRVRWLTRRKLLQLCSAAAACAAAFPCCPHAQGRPTMLTRPIPQTKDPLPVVGLGTWQTFDVGADREALDQRKEVLGILFEGGRAGDRFFADVRPAEEVVGAARGDGSPRQGVPGHEGGRRARRRGIKQMQASAYVVAMPSLWSQCLEMEDPWVS
jgi:hypothetical protein